MPTPPITEWLASVLIRYNIIMCDTIDMIVTTGNDRPRWATIGPDEQGAVLPDFGAGAVEWQESHPVTGLFHF
jgi:hypothetical protein